MLTLSVGILLVQSSLGVWRYPENVGEVIVHVFCIIEPIIIKDKYEADYQIIFCSNHATLLYTLPIYSYSHV